MHREKLIVLGLTLFFTGLSWLHSQTLEDADGNIYLSVTIGKQIWMAENLRTTRYNDGKPIPLVTDDKKWSGLKTPAYCWHSNRVENKDEYGALYNWYTVNTGKLCPRGWHVPTNAEWKTMITFAGDMDLAGDRLKEEGTDHWKDAPGKATNEFGFTAIPAGFRDPSGYFPGFSFAVWWSATKYNDTGVWIWGLNDILSKVFNGYDSMRSGFSVRCIKD